MRLRLGWILIAVLAFAGVLLWRLPVAWVLPLLPPEVRCGQPAGTLWQGRCGALDVRSGAAMVPVGAATWQLEPSALLKARLAGTLQVQGTQVQGQARFSAGAGRQLELRAIDAAVPLDRRFFGMVPPNWTGRVLLKLPLVRFAGERLEALQGDIEVRDVVAQGPRPDDFGSYALHMAGAAPGEPHRGRLEDLGGPLEVSGTLVVQPDLAWQLDALVKARPQAGEGLARLVEYLGPPDAQGRRSLSVAGEAPSR